MNYYIDVNGGYRISTIGSSETLYQVWEKIKGDSYRKLPLQIGCLRKIPYEEPYTNFLQREIQNLIWLWWIERDHSKQATVIDPIRRKSYSFMSTEELLETVPDLSDNEIPLIFYPTK